jgi:hypothetical protein
MNIIQAGVRQMLYMHPGDEACALHPVLDLDIFANAYFGATTFTPTIPKLYAQLCYRPLRTLTCTFDTAYHFGVDQLDYANLGLGWTASETFAFGVDFLHRNAYDWRKADHFNFVLDLSKNQQTLLDSGVSDQRNTLLARLFYQIHTAWSTEIKSRYGFGRPFEPNYFEFKININTILKCNWRLRFTFEHRVGNESKWGDNRFNVGFRLGGKDSGISHNVPIW